MCIGQDLKGLSRIRNKSATFFLWAMSSIAADRHTNEYGAAAILGTAYSGRKQNFVPDDALYYSIKFLIRSCAPKILGSRSDLLYGPVCTQPFFQAGVSQSSRCHFFVRTPLPSPHVPCRRNEESNICTGTMGDVFMSSCL